MPRSAKRENEESEPLVKYEDDIGSLIDDEEDPHTVSGESGTSPRNYSYEEAITRTGYGCFHYKLLLLCGWAVSSDAVEILGISFILPAATTELDLSNSDKGWINSSVFLGMMVGGFLWGTLADLQGRRSVLMWSLTVNALGGLASSLAQTYWLFLLLRFISGIGVGGSMPVIFTYFCEFQPKDRRGSMISVLATFWMGGNILAAAAAWAIIPLDVSITSASGFTYNSWRLYLALCTIPSLSSAAIFVLMPESPKFLMQKGNEIEALSVLQRVHRSNHKKERRAKYSVEHLEVSFGDLDLSSLPLLSRLRLQAAGIVQSTVKLYSAPLTSVSVVMTVIYFTLSFGYYGLFMWFPELFTRIEKYGGSACAPHIPLNDTAPTATTSPGDLANTIYFESFMTAISNLPGNILTIFIIDRVGRKILLSSSMVISGISVFFIYFLDSKTQSLIMSCVFSAISVIGWNALDVLQAELFPTNLRSTASGVLMSVGRIAAVLGNTVFGQFVDSNCAIPMVMVAVLLSGGGLCAIKLPNMTKRDLL